MMEAALFNTVKQWAQAEPSLSKQHPATLPDFCVHGNSGSSEDANITLNVVATKGNFASLEHFAFHETLALYGRRYRIRRNRLLLIGQDGRLAVPRLRAIIAKTRVATISVAESPAW